MRLDEDRRLTLKWRHGSRDLSPARRRRVDVGAPILLEAIGARRGATEVSASFLLCSSADFRVSSSQWIGQSPEDHGRETACANCFCKRIYRRALDRMFGQSVARRSMQQRGSTYDAADAMRLPMHSRESRRCHRRRKHR
jgi:hypothetical protein